MPWDDPWSTAGNGNAFYSNVADSTGSTAGTSAGNVRTIHVMLQYSTNSANITNVGWSSLPTASTLWGYQQQSMGTYVGSGTDVPRWDPVQAGQLRDDYLALKAHWTRKRAEVKARRFFRRVVGEAAYDLFRRRGYYEIRGASRTRYRLRPGMRVQVMKGCADEVEHELCAHLKIGIPWFDSMAVQALMLSSSKETEERFKSIANVHRAHGPYPIEDLTRAA